MRRMDQYTDEAVSQSKCDKIQSPTLENLKQGILKRIFIDYHERVEEESDAVYGRSKRPNIENSTAGKWRLGEKTPSKYPRPREHSITQDEVVMVYG
jgi:hypothetical protein